MKEREGGDGLRMDLDSYMDVVRSGPRSVEWIKTHILYFRYRGAAVRSRALALRTDFNDNNVDKRELGWEYACVCKISTSTTT